MLAPPAAMLSVGAHRVVRAHHHGLPEADRRGKLQVMARKGDFRSVQEVQLHHRHEWLGCVLILILILTLLVVY